MANISSVFRSDERWKSASELQHFQREPKFTPLEVYAFKSLFLNGLTRGSIVEVNGSSSTGKTAASLHILAASTKRGEICAIVDLHNSFHPASAAALGTQLDSLVWVQCQGNIEHALRSVDLLLHSSGFGVVLLDLVGASSRALNRIPLSFWYRFIRAIENTPTILLICAEARQAKSCSRHSLQMKSKAFHWSGHASCKLLKGLEAFALPYKTAHSKVTSIRPEPLLLTVF